uniref:hypothetical protein n=1 Tax=Burkholderia diffusa TaxID=488732 RepID=UPI001CC5337E|nr:hypothetical protein [Burkholderia diffusa]
MCDIYFSTKTKCPELRYFKIFDKKFIQNERDEYIGFANANISRLKLIPILSNLRHKGIEVFSVPIEYRDGATINFDDAFEVAEGYAKLNGIVVAKNNSKEERAPLFWVFDVVGGSDGDRAGGVVMIDRLDAHVWSIDEYEEYMYDYNNIF